MTSFTGTVALVLNAHFPYVRRAGRWPHGEEALHAVIAESYLPLFDLLYDLRTRDRFVPLSLSFSPVLLHQLGDAVINKHFSLWLERRHEQAERDLRRFEADGNGHLQYLSRFYLEQTEVLTQRFHRRFDRNVLHGLRQLLHEQVELVLAPATAAYLPCLDDGALRAQLHIGALTMLRLLGRRPQGLWLPHGGYHPGLPALLSELGIRILTGPAGETQSIGRVEPSHLIMLRGDGEVTEHVVAPSLGYPGDGLYREFYRYGEASGLHYWRVTGVDVPLDAKAYYDPYLAFERAEEHAHHWLQVLRERLHALEQAGRPPVVVVALDAELCGHWWFEGVAWLRGVLQELGAATDIRAVTLADATNESDCLVSPWMPEEVPPPLEGPETAELWEQLAAANSRMRQAARQRHAATGVVGELLAQAAREVMLAASGDWFSLIAGGMAGDYARHRFEEHLARFDRLLHYAQQPEPTPDAQAYLSHLAEVDNVFPHLNYRIWS